MSGLTILGAHGGDVWVESEGELVCLTSRDIDDSRWFVASFGVATVGGIHFDESDLIAIVKAAAGPQIEDCRDCEGPGLANIEGRIVCPGHAAGFGLREARA